MKVQVKQRKSRRNQRGQAMVEYSIINYILIMGLVMVTTVPVFKTDKPADGLVVKTNLIEMMLQAYQSYYDSYYLVLSMPYP